MKLSPHDVFRAVINSRDRRRIKASKQFRQGRKHARALVAMTTKRLLATRKTEL